jgi:hypothetical protein
MLYVVELTIAEAEFTDRMNEMRTWLDHRHAEPSRFRFASGDAAGECRVHFASEADAAAFALQFGGTVSTVAGIAGAVDFNSRSASSSGSGRARPS